MSNTAKNLATIAHKAMVDEIAEIQKRMALRRLLHDLHGARALPINEFYRAATRQQVLSRAPELCEREEKTDAERLARLYELVITLEEQFGRLREADDKAWMDGVAEFFREQRRR